MDSATGTQVALIDILPSAGAPYCRSQCPMLHGVRCAVAVRSDKHGSSKERRPATTPLKLLIEPITPSRLRTSKHGWRNWSGWPGHRFRFTPGKRLSIAETARGHRLRLTGTPRRRGRRREIATGNDLLTPSGAGLATSDRQVYSLAASRSRVYP
jgi:hypothetical protein